MDTQLKNEAPCDQKKKAKLCSIVGTVINSILLPLSFTLVFFGCLGSYFIVVDRKLSLTSFFELVITALLILVSLLPLIGICLTWIFYFRKSYKKTIFFSFLPAAVFSLSSFILKIASEIISLC